MQQWSNQSTNKEVSKIQRKTSVQLRVSEEQSNFMRHYVTSVDSSFALISWVMQAISGPKRKTYSNELMMQTSISFSLQRCYCCSSIHTHMHSQGHMEPFSSCKTLPLTQHILKHTLIDRLCIHIHTTALLKWLKAQG